MYKKCILCFILSKHSLTNMHASFKTLLSDLQSEQNRATHSLRAVIVCRLMAPLTLHLHLPRAISERLAAKIHDHSSPSLLTRLNHGFFTASFVPFWRYIPRVAAIDLPLSFYFPFLDPRSKSPTCVRSISTLAILLGNNTDLKWCSFYGAMRW